MLVNDGGTATQPKAPGHDRPLASTAGAPCRDRLRAAHLAPGQERPFTASAGAAKHGRPRAAPRAPGADIPPATTAEAPGQHRLRAAHLAPGQERPHAALRAAWPGRPRAAPRAPGADVPPATPAGAPGQHRLRAVANATVALPAGQPRRRQEGLPRVPANPRTLIYPHTHHTASSFSRQRKSGPTPANPVGAQHVAPLPPQGGGATGRPALAPLSKCWRGAGGEARPPSPGACSGGGLGRGRRPAHPTTHQVHPAIQVPPHPRPCSTADTGFSRQHPSRVPPASRPPLWREPPSSSTIE